MTDSNQTLRGKTALITGSTSGIGLGIASALAAQGAQIALNGFGDVDGALAHIRSIGVETRHYGADMSKPDEINAMMLSIHADMGGIDILINNAGIQYVAKIEDFPYEKWDAILAINLSSAFHTMHHALPGMRDKNWGRIINIASTHGLVASAQKSAYVAAKHGLIGLTKAAALETATTGITVNAICPGWVLTPLVQKQIEARAASEGTSPEAAKVALLSEKQPSLQFTTPEQLGELAVFLCGSGANNVRGAAWAVDGGWTAQ